MGLPTQQVWVIRPEVPLDDGTLTGRYFVNLHKVVDFDFEGKPIWSEDTIESTIIETVNDIEKFLSDAVDPGIVVE